MLSLYLALIGVAVGVALEALVAELAVAPRDPDDGDEPEPAPPQRGALSAESGALVLAAEGERGVWLRRLVIVGTTSGLFAAAAARFEPQHLALVTAYICVLVVCAATDALSFRVPNVVTYPAILGALVAGAAMPDASIVSVLGGGALAGGLFLLPSLLTGGIGMGMGDVKLAAFAGLALGFPVILPALVVTALAGGAVSLALLVTRVRSRREPIPYAPFIAAGAVAAMLLQGTAFVSLG